MCIRDRRRVHGDIMIFFRGLRIQKNGIKRSFVGGKPSSECFVLFETKEEAVRASTLNNEKIGDRFVEIGITGRREFEHFVIHNFMTNGPTYSKDNMPNIPLDKRKSTLMVVGLPYNITIEEVRQFFNSFDLREQDIYLLSTHSGKFSGNSLITFCDEIEARRALKTKHLSYLGDRYIEIYEYK
eukprot:TRINITY_DN3637_c0_g1_i4.p1 TRINITY_DN3637_c0_g1~~TRINITY_DN3637_c0_g1_i4.p1  ORF type:complete len:184 (+),score=41.26 TRINITY_DN3637_c0_g1_i4:65-616(+)